MLTESEVDEIHNLVEKLVCNAGQYMREGFVLHKKEYVQKAAFFDLVTEYDKKIEDLLVNGIKTKYSHHKFIGEEDFAETKQTPVLTDDPTWIIDPIDGTTNFIKKIPHACISIALAVKKELIIGIIYNPVLNELFTAKKGRGAYMNGEIIRANSNVKTMNQAVLGYEISLVHAQVVRDKNFKRLYKMAPKATGTRCFGSAALTLCYVANGLIDCYPVDDLKPWDIAAGALIAKEAGAVVLNPKGREFNIMKPDIVCAASSELAKELIDLIEEACQMNEFTFV